MEILVDIKAHHFAINSPGKNTRGYCKILYQKHNRKQWDSGIKLQSSNRKGGAYNKKSPCNAGA
jgi:hypothetical protein